MNFKQEISTQKIINSTLRNQPNRNEDIYLYKYVYENSPSSIIHNSQKLFESESRSVLSDSLRPHGLYSPWNSPGQHTGVGSCSLLQGVFPIQGSNPGLLHCRWILYQLSHLGSHQENSGRSSSNPNSFLFSCVTSVMQLLGIFSSFAK